MWLRRFGRAREGVTALEFALVAVPFLTIMFAILETGYVFFLAILIEGATADASRQIRTGAA
jgi:Flp pilus assembly protein TadG